MIDIKYDLLIQQDLEDLTVFYDVENVFKCKTLEIDLPSGSYEVEKYTSPELGRCFRVIGGPVCISFKTVGNRFKDGELTIGRQMINKMIKILPNKFHMIIVK